MTRSLPTPILAGALAALALAWTPAPAALAEVPSVDAYGGEALVLGAPHHHRPGGGAGAGNRGASAGAGGQAGSHGSSSATSGTTGSAKGTRAGAGGGSATGGRSAPGGSAAGSGEAGADQRGAGEARNGRGNSRPASFDGRSASSSSAFSTLELLVAIAGVLCLAMLALALRTARKPS